MQGYYAIIPADVRYSEIQPNAKLLYGEITALSNRFGYCFATNDYFAKLYKVETRQVQRWMTSLSEAGFIGLEYENGKRQIQIVNPGQKRHPPMTLMTPPHDKKDTHNNIYNNTNNSYYYGEEKEQKKEILDIDEFRSFLNKGKLMERFYYKIGSEESWERSTMDFFLFCEEKGKPLNSKTCEARFVAYMKPKWESEQDRNALKEAYNRKHKATRIIDNASAEQEENERKMKEMREKISNIEAFLTVDQKKKYMDEAEKQIDEITKGRGKNMGSYQLMVIQRYGKILLEQHIEKENLI